MSSMHQATWFLAMVPAITNCVSFTGRETGLAVLGPNSIGKTTLLKCTDGPVKWNTWETDIDGHE